MDVRPQSAQANRDTVLLITTISSFFIPFMSSAVNVALPTIGKQYGMDVVTLGWVSTSYMLASSSLLVPFGRLADIYGRRALFIMGIIIFLIGSVLSAVSVSSAMLLASRAVQGVGGAAIFSTSVAILTAAFPPQERGRVLGINTASVYIGLSVGPFLGGFLTQYTGWKSIFLIASIMTLIVMVLTFWRLKGESSGTNKEKFDFAGSIAYALALVLTMYGVSRLPRAPALWFIGSGILVGVIFVLWQTQVKVPLVNIRLFRRNRGFSFSNLAALVNYAGTFAVTFLLSLYLQYARGLNPRVTGIILIASPVVQAIFSPLFGELSDRTEPRILASAGMAITALGIGLLAFTTQTTPYWFIIVCLVILGFGFALFSSPNTNAVMSSVERQDYGIASATLATMRQLGMMLSMGISWAVLAILIGRVEIRPEHHAALVSSLRITFIISAALCVGAIFFSLARGNILSHHIHESASEKGQV